MRINPTMVKTRKIVLKRLGMVLVTGMLQEW